MLSTNHVVCPLFDALFRYVLVFYIRHQMTVAKTPNVSLNTKEQPTRYSSLIVLACFMHLFAFSLKNKHLYCYLHPSALKRDRFSAIFRNMQTLLNSAATTTCFLLPSVITMATANEPWKTKTSEMDRNLPITTDSRNLLTRWFPARSA